MNNEELKRILENHMHWLKQDCKGWESMRADLSYIDLSYANLSYANLSNANLYYANLYKANLYNAILCGVDLYHADLSCADLSCANLYYANLYYSNLNNVDLSYTNLSCAKLCYANLSDANLCYANLCCANLRYAKYVPYIPLACPEAGSFVAFKKARGFIIKLEIPEDAKRLSATTNKCRSNKAKVLEIQNIDGTTASISEISSDYDKTFIYKVGETVTAMNFDDDRWNECSTGIHFFINRQDAVNYF